MAKILVDIDCDLKKCGGCGLLYWWDRYHGHYCAGFKNKRNKNIRINSKKRCAKCMAAEQKDSKNNA